MPTLNGKTAIVTGASRGIGAAVAQRLAADGFAVVVNFAGRAEEARDQVDLIRKADGMASAIDLRNIRRHESWRRSHDARARP